MSNDRTSAPARAEDPVGSKRLLDRTSVWFVALVFAATTAISVQTVWWLWHPIRELDDHSTWTLLYVVVSTASRVAWVRWLVVLGAALVALAAVGVMLQRAWGLLLALPCSASLIACTILARYAAVFSEPRQYVSRSHYVQAATVVALVTVASHGAAMIVGVRVLCRRPVRLALVRLALGVMAALVAGLPVLWIHEHLPGGTRNAVMVCACAAVALAALVACGVPRRGVVLATLGVSLAALAVLAVGLALHLHDRPKRGRLYSIAAEQAISEVVIAAPLVIALVGVCLVMRRHLAAAHAHGAHAPGSAA